ncbi:MAG: peptidase U32 family protein, partial [Methanosarcinaceae archaeon]
MSRVIATKELMILNNEPANETIPEILAPAGDYEALVGAIKGGADAIYLGAGEFNARRGAQNFKIEELQNAISLAHFHRTRVFLALNIPLKQGELQGALDLVDMAYGADVDAIILRDLGLMDLLRQIYPDLKLHASTQMTIHNKAGVRFVEAMGAKRVIVARELTTDEVADIVDSSDIEIEVFVHGALCYSYSGRCMFSSAISTRSGNRGACTQPCRFRYRLMVDGQEMNQGIGSNFPISCAELCTLPGLDKIVKTGVVSLKIEGRMKRPEYVTDSTSIYKEMVSNILNNQFPDSKEITNKENELARLFHRGFTRGFILDDRNVSNSKHSSNHGAFLGTVLNIVRYKDYSDLTIKLQQDIRVNDGIAILTQKRMLGSAVSGVVSSNGENVTHASQGDTVKLQISPKTGKAIRHKQEVYLTTDKQLLDRLQKIEMTRYPLDIKVIAKANGPLIIKVHEGRGEAEIIDEYIIQHARQAPTTLQQIQEIMERLGDTPYVPGDVEIEADENIFIPLGVLTKARRKVVDTLLQKVLHGYG